ncbi:hypothetical protein L6R53_09925 [Myxococcota bacterium]|nr:hypothetical protein [Myxococcota bacterium]
MSRSVLVPLLALTLSACAPPEDDVFGGGGGGGDGGSGDGGTDDTGTWVDDGVSPVIDAVTAEFYTPPNYDTVLQVYIWWTDAQGDVDGGKVDYGIQGSDGSNLSGTLDITGTEARLDDDVEGTPVYFWVAGIDTGLSYEVEVELQDAAGNRSQSATATTP